MPLALDLYGGGDFRSNTHRGGFDCVLSSDMVQSSGGIMRG